MTTFTTGFKPFACEGDTITCEIGGMTATARLYRDDDADAPDERSDGFWPSLDSKNAGYIGRKSKKALADAMAQAQATMDAWRNDEWFYCGVVVTVEKAGVRLTGKYESALWGVECNFPGTNNSYLLEVANELLDEALDAARAKLASLCACEAE